MVNIDEAEDRAKRALDGMSYNRDVMARDVVGMAAELRNWRAAFERLKAKETPKQAPDFQNFSEAFGDIFGDVFGKKK